MATRSRQRRPGPARLAAQHGGLTAAELADGLERRSGLAGLAGCRPATCGMSGRRGRGRCRRLAGHRGVPAPAAAGDRRDGGGDERARRAGVHRRGRGAPARASAPGRARPSSGSPSTGAQPGRTGDADICAAGAAGRDARDHGPGGHRDRPPGPRGALLARRVQRGADTGPCRKARCRNVQPRSPSPAACSRSGGGTATTGPRAGQAVPAHPGADQVTHGAAACLHDQQVTGLAGRRDEHLAGFAADHPRLGQPASRGDPAPGHLQPGPHLEPGSRPATPGAGNRRDGGGQPGHRQAAARRAWGPGWRRSPAPPRPRSAAPAGCPVTLVGADDDPTSAVHSNVPSRTGVCRPPANRPDRRPGPILTAT